MDKKECIDAIVSDIEKMFPGCAFLTKKQINEYTGMSYETIIKKFKINAKM